MFQDFLNWAKPVAVGLVCSAVLLIIIIGEYSSGESEMRKRVRQMTTAELHHVQSVSVMFHDGLNATQGKNQMDALRYEIRRELKRRGE
jgi:hypothetical protein